MASAPDSRGRPATGGAPDRPDQLDDAAPSIAANGPLDQDAADLAARRYWDGAADGYQSDHGGFLAGGGDRAFVWGPEGVSEADLRLLGPEGSLRGARVLEVGCGAAQCSHWLEHDGVTAVGIDISVGQLRHAPAGTPVAAASATALPFGAGTFDLAFSAYGAVQFVADLPALLREVHRVLRPEGRWVFSVTHPIRWALPDDPGADGLRVTHSYFDRAPYVERTNPGGEVDYAEFHRTLGDYAAALSRTGFLLQTLTEPEWPDWNEHSWGGWSPRRGRLVPGTLIVGCRAVASGDRAAD